MLAITATDKEKFEFRLVASHDTYQMRAQSYKQLLEWTSYMDKVAPCWRKPKVAAYAVTFAAKMKRQAAARRSSEEAAYALTTPSTARALAIEVNSIACHKGQLDCLLWRLARFLDSKFSSVLPSYTFCFTMTNSTSSRLS